MGGSGVNTIGMLFLDKTLMTHDTFVREQGVPHNLFLLHAHAIRYVRSTWALEGTEPPTHELVNMQYLMGRGRNLTRWLYRGIRTHAATSLQVLRDKWNADLQRDLTDKEWAHLIEYQRTVSRNPIFKFIQLMIVHCAYLTPRRLHKMFPGTSDTCPRCHAPNADLLHMLWNCPRIAPY